MPKYRFVVQYETVIEEEVEAANEDLAYDILDERLALDIPNIEWYQADVVEVYDE